MSRLVCVCCGKNVYLNPSPCVSVLIMQGNEVLLVKRTKYSAIKPGMWCLPCGYMELKENIVQAAKREVREETGLLIETDRIINVTSNHFPDVEDSIVTVILAHPVGGILHAGDDADKVKWFPEDALPEMAFKADLHIIGQYLKYGNDLGIAFEETEIDFFE